MFGSRASRFPILSVLVLSALCAATAGAAGSAHGPGAGVAAGKGRDDAFVRTVRVLDSRPTDISVPVGLAAMPNQNVLFVVQARGARRTNVVSLDRVGRSVGSAQLRAGALNPINMAFDARRHRLLLLSAHAQLLEVQVNARGNLVPKTLQRLDVKQFGLTDPQGMAVDRKSGALYILDAGHQRVVRVQPTADGSFRGAVRSELDLRPNGLGAVRGLAFDPQSGHLYVRSGKTLTELTTAGKVVARRDLDGLGVDTPQGMVVAPSSDQTDAPTQLSLYVADSRGPAIRTAGASAGDTGQIVELSFAPVETPTFAQNTFTSSVVRTVDLAAISPPSPDPTGLTYLPGSNTLLMTDSDVEEDLGGTTHFQGANVWELTLGGSVVRTTNISVEPTVFPMSEEPSGVAFKPSSGHCFVSDDSQKQVYDLNPGADGACGTGDDSSTFFSTNAVGNTDPRESPTTHGTTGCSSPTAPARRSTSTRSAARSASSTSRHMA